MQIKTKKLRTILSAIATQSDEATFRSTDDGWTIKALDPSHVSMISVTVPSTAFTGYQKSDDFALSLKNVIKALSNADDDVGVTVENGRFTVESAGLRSRFPLLAVAAEDPRIPTLEYDAGVMLEAGTITKISNAVYGNSIESYAFEIKDDTLTITAEDSSGNGAALRVAKAQCLELKGQARSCFTIDMLDRFLKCLDKESVIELQLGNDVPVTIKVNDAEIQMIYLLAPRIESGE